jgi:hypothetical protein
VVFNHIHRIFPLLKYRNRGWDCALSSVGVVLVAGTLSGGLHSGLLRRAMADFLGFYPLCGTHGQAGVWYPICSGGRL